MNKGILSVYERTNNGQACENAADPKAQKWYSRSGKTSKFEGIDGIWSHIR